MIDLKLFEIILYVSDQKKSRDFYSAVLNMLPQLDVPGMTEFQINTSLKLGLIPEFGIAKILADKTPHPATGNGIPRCELYLYVENIKEAFETATSVGANIISPIQDRDWGDKAGYLSDPDGHIIAFARKIN